MRRGLSAFLKLRLNGCGPLTLAPPPPQSPHESEKACFLKGASTVRRTSLLSHFLIKVTTLSLQARDRNTSSARLRRTAPSLLLVHPSICSSLPQPFFFSLFPASRCLLNVLCKILSCSHQLRCVKVNPANNSQLHSVFAIIMD